MNYFDKILKQNIKERPLILGIETSCDDTCAAVVCDRQVLSNHLASSALKHAEFGGVVPEIASREHTDALSNMVELAIRQAGVSLAQIDAVAVTYGSGLLGSLLVGVSFAKALAFAIEKPLIAVNHIRGHIAASYLIDKTLKPPFICLLASGGHTAVIKVEDYVNYRIIGTTVDDAAGEAFDKVARTLNLSYPGGPSIEKLAKQGKATIKLPEMFKNDKKTFNFSYSGLKTAVINYINTAKMKGLEINAADVAASFQKAAIDVLIERALRASKKYKINTIVTGGGVAANSYLRENLQKECLAQNIKLVMPSIEFCTDNAAMIAMEGALQYSQKNFAPLDLNAKARIGL